MVCVSANIEGTGRGRLSPGQGGTQRTVFVPLDSVGHDFRVRETTDCSSVT
jgi:hypothetical protein